MKKQVKKCAKSAKKTTKKNAAAKKAARKPAKSAAREDGIFIAPDADDATGAAEAPKNAKPAAKAKKPTKVSAAKPAAAKPTKEKKPAARPDFKPVELPATFDDEDGFSITVAADSITFTRGMFKVIFSPRRAHFFPRDVSLAGGKPLPQTIKAGSVSLVSGQTGIVISADNAEAVAAILTAKAAARAKKDAEKPVEGKGVRHD